MFRHIWPAAVAALALGGVAAAEEPATLPPIRENSVSAAAPLAFGEAMDQSAAATVPLKLGEAPDQSVYALPQPQTEEQGINLGGVNLDMKVTYFTDYVYRGVDRAKQLNPTRQPGSSANFQFDGSVTWNLGKLPHPYVGVFTNVFAGDPISDFQEVRPYIGFEWKIRPLIIGAGNNTYEYPNRSGLDTNEAWVKITLDDAAVLKRDEPLLSPYIYAAYDYDLYHGFYIEAGVHHDFAIQKTGLTLTPEASVAYVSSDAFFSKFPHGTDSGFQHWEVGLLAKYSLNVLLNIPQRYGQYALTGYLLYSHGINDQLLGDTLLYGGAGLEFSY